MGILGSLKLSQQVKYAILSTKCKKKSIDKQIAHLVYKNIWYRFRYIKNVLPVTLCKQCLINRTLFAMCISVGEHQSCQASKAKKESEKPDSFQHYAANVGTARVLDADFFLIIWIVSKSLYLLRCISHGRPFFSYSISINFLFYQWEFDDAESI